MTMDLRTLKGGTLQFFGLVVFPCSLLMQSSCYVASGDLRLPSTFRPSAFLSGTGVQIHRHWLTVATLAVVPDLSLYP